MKPRKESLVVSPRFASELPRLQCTKEQRPIRPIIPYLIGLSIAAALIWALGAGERYFSAHRLSRRQQSAGFAIFAIVCGLWSILLWGVWWIFFCMVAFSLCFVWACFGSAREWPGFRPPSDPDFEGLSVEESRDAGGCVITYFAIPAGREHAAGRDLLACLAEGDEVLLRNDLDESGEGATSFRGSPPRLETMTGGHGWQSDWKPIDEAGFLAAVASLAQHNRGGPWAQGQIIRHSRPA